MFRLGQRTCGWLSILLGVVCFIIGNPTIPAYAGYKQLTWESLKGFTQTPTTTALPLLAPYPQGVISWDIVGSTNRKHRAESGYFVIPGPMLELAVAGSLALSPQLRPTVALVGANEEVLADFSLPVSHPGIAPTNWAPERFCVDKRFVGKEAKFIFRNPPNPAPEAWFALRERVDFFAKCEEPPSSSARLSSSYYFVALLFIFFGVLFVARLELSSLNNVSLFLLFLLVTLLFQLRTASFFYWDEWHVLERFETMGFPGVVYTHNEHFLPLFFAWYFIEAKLFGNHYLVFLLMSAVLHAINALLLTQFLGRFASLFPGARRAAVILALCFVCNSLHAETLQWAFEQSILLFQFFCTSALILCVDYLRKGGWWRVPAIGLFALGAPLCFGNGFSLGLQVGVVALFLEFIPTYFSNRGLLRQSLLRFAGMIFSISVFAGIALFLYDTHKESTGHGVDRVHPLGHAEEVAEYLWVGTQFGTLLRGLGVFPALGPESAQEALKDLGYRGAHPFLFLANIGFLLSIAILSMSFFWNKRKRDVFLFWIAGELLLVASLILPSFGRFQLGVGQSLSLRYHYSTFVGLCVLCLPFVSAVTLAFKESRYRIIMFVGLLLISFIHFAVSQNFDYFTKQGFEHRLFVSELTSWKKELRQLASTHASLDYEASGTPLAGLHPAHRETITPGRHPNDIYRVLHWLNAEEFQE